MVWDRPLRPAFHYARLLGPNRQKNRFLPVGPADDVSAKTEPPDELVVGSPKGGRGIHGDGQRSLLLEPSVGLDDRIFRKDHPLFEHSSFVAALILAVALDHPLLTLQNDRQRAEFGSLVRANTHAEPDLIPSSHFGGTQLNGGLAKLSAAQSSPKAL